MVGLDVWAPITIGSVASSNNNSRNKRRNRNIADLFEDMLRV